MVTRLLAALAALAVACAPPPPRRLVIPEAMRRQPPAPPTAATRAEGQPSAIPPQRYVLRLAQQGRVWELELPDQTQGYEVRIPLAGTGPAEMLTPADEEILADAAPRAPPGAKAASLDPRKAALQRSYLGGLARVSELYQARKYELALVEVVNLEAAYPQDARIVAMKGSLYVKLGKKKLARETWQKALSLNPSDAGVAEALRELGNAEE
jgi:tetratricopeptide (TPR) repeat protein